MCSKNFKITPFLKKLLSSLKSQPLVYIIIRLITSSYIAVTFATYMLGNFLYNAKNN